MFIAEAIYKKQKVKIKTPSMNKQNVVYPSTEYYSAIKNNMLIHAPVRMNLENIKSSERSQIYEATFSIFPLI